MAPASLQWLDGLLRDGKGGEESAPAAAVAITGLVLGGRFVGGSDTHVRMRACLRRIDDDDNLHTPSIHPIT